MTNYSNLINVDGEIRTTSGKRFSSAAGAAGASGLSIVAQNQYF